MYNVRARLIRLSRRHMSCRQDSEDVSHRQSLMISFDSKAIRQLKGGNYDSDEGSYAKDGMFGEDSDRRRSSAQRRPHKRNST
jgi:hypothetical protein